MGRKETTLLAIGGGEITEAPDIVEEFKKHANNGSKGILVLTIATSKPAEAAAKYTDIFKKMGYRNVSVVDVSDREESYDEKSAKKVEEAEAMFFTGGDQLNITTMIGGSPIQDAIEQRVKEGGFIAGTSAGAAMMSQWMIVSGRSDSPTKVNAVEIAPGMGMVDNTVIDTHFSQRGRHGRLLTAVAHYPQAIGIGLDEATAIAVKGSKFRVLGKGVATVMDGHHIRKNDLPHRKDDEMIGISGMVVDILPAGYVYDLATFETFAPELSKMAGTEDEV
jgi:cyanophycinase